MQRQGSISMQGQGKGSVKGDGPRSNSNRASFDGSKGQGKGHGTPNAGIRQPGNPNVMNQNRGGPNQGAGKGGANNKGGNSGFSPNPMQYKFENLSCRNIFKIYQKKVVNEIRSMLVTFEILI